MLQILTNPNHLKDICPLVDDWLATKENTITIKNPFDNQTIGTVPKLDGDDVKFAIDRACAIQTTWATLTAHERGQLLHAWADLIQQHTDDLARLMTLESGKPIKEAKGEIGYANSFIRFFAEEGKRAYGDVIPTNKQGQRYVVTKQPIGICAAITPWNFPAAMISRKVAPALAAGCPILVKPATQTPFSALALAYLARLAGIPKGVFQILTGDAKTLGDVLCQSVQIKKLSFTGSTNVGKYLMAQCANTLKKLSLELGGNAPFIVFDDANIDKAVDGLIASKHRNAGQTCVCANRVYLHQAIKDQFLDLYSQKVKALSVGNPMDEQTDIGSLIDDKALNKTCALLQDALDKGATLITGGQIASIGKHSFAPTIITNLNTQMDIAHEEIFAPITAIYDFASEEEVIRFANDTPFGLAAYVYTNDLARAWRMMEGLDYGMIGQNTGLISNEVSPFGGIKQSGFGREGSKYGLDEYLTLKYWCVQL